MASKSFTNTAKKDIPSDMDETEYTRMYAAWGKFIELSGSFIPWDKFLDYSEPESYVIGTDAEGKYIIETIIKLRHTGEIADEALPDVQ